MGAAEFCWHAANQLIQKKLADMQADIALTLQGCLPLGCMKGGGCCGGNYLDDEAQQLRQVLDLAWQRYR